MSKSEQKRLMPICVILYFILQLFIGNNSIFIEINLTKEKDFNSIVY